MFKPLDTSKVASYISGIPIDPRNVSVHHDFEKLAEPGYDSELTLKTDILKEDSALVRHRWQNHQYDMRDQLVSVYKGSRMTSRTVGRQWGAGYGKFRLRFRTSAPWGDTSVGIEPAVSALATNTMESGSITAWTNLNQMLGIAARGTAVDRGLMASLNRIHGGKVNTVRFVYRLAALYWHALFSEGYNCTVDALQPPALSSVGSITALVAHITSGTTGRNFIPWLVPGTPDVATMLPVLYLAASTKVRCSQGSNATRFLKFWPSLGDDVCLLADSAQLPALNGLRNTTLTASLVWYVAQRWVGVYSDLTLWDEAIRVVGAACVSPAPGMAWIPDTAVEFALPQFSTGVYGAAMILTPNIEVDLGTAKRCPSSAVLVEDAVCTGLILGLVNWLLTWRVVGWYYDHGLCNDSDAAEYWRRFQSTLIGPGAWRAAQAALEGLGFSGKIGRVFSSARMLTNNQWRNLTRFHPTVVQWEELICRYKTVSADAAIYGSLYPLRPTRATLKYGRWCKVGDIPEAKTIEHAYSSLRHGSEWRLHWNDPGLGSRTTGLNLYKNYAGEAPDYNIFAGHDREGRMVTPIFKVNDRDFYTAVVCVDSPLHCLDWYVEKPDSVPLNPGLATLISADLPPDAGRAPPGPPGGYKPAGDPDGHPDGDDFKSESDEGESDSEFEETDPITETTVLPTKKYIPPAARPDRRKAEVVDKGDDALDEPCTKAVEAMLKRASNFRDRGPGYREAADVERLYNSGVPAKTCGLFYLLLTEGVPGGHNASPVLDAYMEIDMLDTMRLVPVIRRSSVAGKMASLANRFMALCPGTSQSKQVARKYMAFSAAEAALKVDPAISAEEVMNHGAKARKKFGISGQDGEAYHQLVTEGRLPSDAEARRLLTAGYPIICGISGESSIRADDVLSGEVTLAQDTVRQMVEVMIMSAEEANVPVDVKDIQDMVGTHFNVAQFYEEYLASKRTVSMGAELNPEAVADEKGGAESINECSPPLARTDGEAVTEPTGGQSPTATAVGVEEPPTVEPPPAEENSQPSSSLGSVADAFSQMAIEQPTAPSGEDAPAVWSQSSGDSGVGEIYEVTFVDPKSGGTGSAL